jgi:hypothetical protein
MRVFVQALIKYGRYSQAPGGAEKIVLGKKEYQRCVDELKKALQDLGRVKGVVAIVEGDEIITVYKNPKYYSKN